MPSLRQKILVFLCALLCGCAAGMSEETEPVELIAVPDSSAALAVDAGLPLLPSAVGSTTDPAIATPPQAPVVTQSPVPTTSLPSTGSAATVDASTPSSTPSGASASTSSEAGAALVDSDASAPDAANSTTSDASTTPSAPMCVVEQCNNNCLLLPRCCNEQNQCACYSLLRRSCSL